MLNEAGLSKEQVGKVDMRDSHTLVEVQADQVERVAAALDGKSIRGRRINARADMAKEEREGRGERPARGDRPERAPRGDRPPRAGGDRERPARGGAPRGRDDGPRNPFGGERREVGGERVDFNERAERMRRAKRAPKPRAEGGWEPAEGADE